MAKNRIASMGADEPNGNGSGEDVATKKAKSVRLIIPAPDMRRVLIPIEGVDPYMQLRFSRKQRDAMLAKQEEGSAARSKKTRVAKDVNADFEGAQYRFADNSNGIPASAFRQACVSACRTVGFKMTVAKLSLFVIADGLDFEEGTPLVKLEGTPQISIMPVRNANGNADLRVRALWPKWSAKVLMEYDAGQMGLLDIVNLMARAGLQVGVGEGRPDSKASSGIGMGRFKVDLENVVAYEPEVIGG